MRSCCLLERGRLRCRSVPGRYPACLTAAGSAGCLERAREICGILATEGVYLSGATYWYPRFNDEMVTFTIDVQLPLTWEVISQGEHHAA